jgi:hypothetical protein
MPRASRWCSPGCATSGIEARRPPASKDDLSTSEFLHNGKSSGPICPVPIPYEAQKPQIESFGAAERRIRADLPIAGHQSPEDAEHAQPGRHVEVNYGVGRAKAGADHVGIVAVDDSRGQSGHVLHFGAEHVRRRLDPARLPEGLIGMEDRQVAMPAQMPSQAGFAAPRRPHDDDSPHRGCLIIRTWRQLLDHMGKGQNKRTITLIPRSPAASNLASGKNCFSAQGGCLT